MSGRTLILIAGMHRSGTSALTRALNLAGVPLPRNLLPPRPGDNEEGFWESQDLFLINERILHSLKSKWDDPRAIPETWFTGPQASQARAELSAWIESEMADKTMLAVKEPRLCRLLPLWNSACDTLGLELRTVIPIRNPIEVARSLNRRNNTPPIQSALLWLRHFLDAERYSRGRSRCFVTFEDLLRTPAETVEHIATELAISLKIDRSQLEVRLAEAIKPKLRHELSSDAELEKAFPGPSPLRVAYAWALRATRGVEQSFESLDAINKTMGQQRPS